MKPGRYCLLGLCLITLNTFAIPIFKFDFSSDLLLGGFAQQNNKSISNPSNQVLFLPSQSLNSEIKSTLKVESPIHNFKVVLVPRIQLRQVTYEFSSTTENRNLSDYGFWEAYANYEIVKNLDFAVGIVNSQWGPSDIISPSQFLFSDLTIKPEPFQSTQGLEMAKAQWTPSQNWTLTAIAELEAFRWEHTDTPPIKERNSKKRILLRTEYATNSGDVTLGFVLGQKRTDRNRVQAGSYALWNYSHFTQLYYDFVLQQGSERLYVDNTGIIVTPFADNKSIFQIGLLGHRFTFANGMEWRIEYIQNDFGQSSEQRSRSFQQLRTNPAALQYIAVINDSSSPLPGQQFIYNTLRWDNAAFLQSLFSSSHIFLRNIYSMTDNSQLINIGVETSLSDHLSHSVAFINSIGNNESELATALKSYFSYFLKYSF